MSRHKQPRASFPWHRDRGGREKEHLHTTWRPLGKRQSQKMHGGGSWDKPPRPPPLASPKAPHGSPAILSAEAQLAGWAAWAIALKPLLSLVPDCRSPGPWTGLPDGRGQRWLQHASHASHTRSRLAVFLHQLALWLQSLASAAEKGVSGKDELPSSRGVNEGEGPEECLGREGAPCEGPAPSCWPALGPQPPAPLHLACIPPSP